MVISEELIQENSKKNIKFEKRTGNIANIRVSGTEKKLTKIRRLNLQKVSHDSFSRSQKQLNVDV